MDDDSYARKMIRTILTAQGLEVVGEADDGDQVLPAIAEHRPDVVLIDLQMRRIGGVEAIRQVAALANGPRCVALTGFGTEDAIVQALGAGAAGFLSKDDGPETLAGHLRAVATGGGALGPDAAAAIIRRLTSSNAPNDRRADALAKLTVLTDKERTVAGCLVGGMTNGQIAPRLHMSENTVKAHITRALTKLDLSSRTELGILADRAGLTAPG